MTPNWLNFGMTPDIAAVWSEYIVTRRDGREGGGGEPLDASQVASREIHMLTECICTFLVIVLMSTLNYSGQEWPWS